MATHQDLRAALRKIDGAGYKAYKSIRGAYQFPEFTLHIDQVQGDPFAAPSRMRVVVPAEVAAFSADLYEPQSRAIGSATYLATQFAERASRVAARRGSGKSGLIEIFRPGQQVLERTSLTIGGGGIEARFVVGLPASGRRVLGREAAEMLLGDLPDIVAATLKQDAIDRDAIREAAVTNEDAEALRLALPAMGLVAFVANGSVLPRRSGVDDQPLDAAAVPFRSPPSLEVEISLPGAGKVRGMGIPDGVTLIVGGGFHGKSTLLNALERAVYNHRPADGRTQVATIDSAVKIRAEDSRSVCGVDISPFIDELPGGRTTTSFTSANASGSTSQAANIMEALEVGARLLLIDEDTAATNFMIRDHRMQELIAKEMEPITPFVDKVRQLYTEHGVSSIIVAGGSGDYFDVADRVIAMESYVPRDVSAEAAAIAAKYKSQRSPEGGDTFGNVCDRVPDPVSVDPSRGRREESVKIRGRHTIQFGHETIDLSAVSQIVDSSQTRAIVEALLRARARTIDGQRPLTEIIAHIESDIAASGLDALTRTPRGDLAVFRRFELAAALNRLRSLELVR